MYNQFAKYVFFGVLTTAINLAVYYIFIEVFMFDYQISITVSWAVAVSFAFVTNKLYVFESRRNVYRPFTQELFLYFAFRLLSLVLELGMMLIMVALFKVDDFISKASVTILIVVFNYFASKQFIFKRFAKVVTSPQED